MQASDTKPESQREVDMAILFDEIKRLTEETVDHDATIVQLQAEKEQLKSENLREKAIGE